jgi:hypothetical protein
VGSGTDPCATTIVDTTDQIRQEPRETKTAIHLILHLLGTCRNYKKVMLTAASNANQYLDIYYLTFVTSTTP